MWSIITSQSAAEAHERLMRVGKRQLASPDHGPNLLVNCQQQGDAQFRVTSVVGP
jgi:hypothetical protein